MVGSSSDETIGITVGGAAGALGTNAAALTAAGTCTLYYLRSASDTFGCELQENYYELPKTIKDIIGQRGHVSPEVGV
jgi:hypothetical protein